MTITGELVTLFILVFGAIAGVWYRVEAKIESAKQKAVDAADSLSLYKTHVAETYVSKQGLREFRDEVMGGVGEIKASVSSLNHRIDRVIESPSPKRAQRAQS